MHGPSLHGFAVLLLLAKGPRAASIAAAALAEGVERAGELRHPERAAAWLRSRVVRLARRAPASKVVTPVERAALAELGVSPAAAEALSGLALPERAALIASSVERFSIADVASILGRDQAATLRVLRSARRRYVEAVTPQLDDGGRAPLDGELAARVERLARGAIGPRTADAPGR